MLRKIVYSLFVMLALAVNAAAAEDAVKIGLNFPQNGTVRETGVRRGKSRRYSRGRDKRRGRRTW